MNASALQLIIPIAGVVAVLFALYLARDVLSRDKGPQAMQDIGDSLSAEYGLARGSGWVLCWRS